MPETVLELLKKHLDTEGRSDALSPLPGDFYSRISIYSQRLRRSTGTGNSEVANRLISRQVSMIRSMSSQLLDLRAQKATALSSFAQMLPEERYVCSARRRFKRRFETFVEALSAGQPSFVEFAHRNETTREVKVRFTKRVNELVGMDFRHYGPFEPDDLASIPSADADVLIAVGDAVEIFTREES